MLIILLLFAIILPVMFPQFFVLFVFLLFFLIFFSFPYNITFNFFLLYQISISLFCRRLQIQISTNPWLWTTHARNWQAFGRTRCASGQTEVTDHWEQSVLTCLDTIFRIFCFCFCHYLQCLRMIAVHTTLTYTLQLNAIWYYAMLQAKMSKSKELIDTTWRRAVQLWLCIVCNMLPILSLFQFFSLSNYLYHN